MINEHLFTEIRNGVNRRLGKSAWDRGVKEYAYELIDQLEQDIIDGTTDINLLKTPLDVKNHLLNGAKDWREYSYGGQALIWDMDIANRLCTPSELSRTRDGDKKPNRYENWVDVQTRALTQAGYAVAYSTLDALKRLDQKGGE